MLWLLSLHEVQFLLAIWLIQLMYAAVVTVGCKWNWKSKAIAIPILFAACYQTIMVSNSLLGTPKFTNDEITGTLAGYAEFKNGDQKELAVLLITKTGPIMFAVPYDPKSETDLRQAMNQLATTGKPTLVRKKSNNQLQNAKQTNKNGKEGQGNQVSGNLELYDFTDQLLVPKGQKDQ